MPIFVIQKHAATHLHYDFRLEIDGVLKSWSVPKGVSTDPKEKRLAILTQDHPLEYAKFEGEISVGHYGAGTVIIWDSGTYKNLKDKSMQQCFDNGKIEIEILGKKIHGNYALIHTHIKDNKDKAWLLIKMKDDNEK